MNTQRDKNCGSVLICVLVCLLIVTGLAASMVKSALQARRFVRQQRQQVQAQFLLEAGIRRAVQKLNADAVFSGETWELDEEIIPGSAVVEIKVSPDDVKTVEVIAQLPANSPLSVRRSYTFAVSNEE